MTTGSIISWAAGGGLAAFGVVAEVASDLGDWGKILAGGSAATLVAFLFVYVLKHTTAAQEKANTTFAEAVKDGHAKLAAASEKFAAAVTEQGNRCDETTTTLLREARTSHEAREKMLIDTLKEFRKP